VYSGMGVSNAVVLNHASLHERVVALTCSWYLAVAVTNNYILV